MKHILVVRMKWNFRLILTSAIFISLFFSSCEPGGTELGVDIFPSDDTIEVYTDTITDLKTMLVRSRPRITSESLASASSSREFLLGSKRDSLTGISSAEIVTSLTILTAGDFGQEPLIDSLILSFYVSSVYGDTTQDMHIKVYEFLDTLFYDRDYYSDYNVSDKYNPVPLVDEVIVPKPNTYYEFNIEDPEYFGRIVAAAKDTVFQHRSLVHKLFRGFYITTETVPEEGAIAGIQLASGLSGLKFRYLHDSISIDTATSTDYRSYALTFNEKYAEKVNIFHHDFTGSQLESLIDNPDAEPEIGYAQGMAGVNTMVTIPDLREYVGDGLVALNTARLIFYVVPDTISGLSYEKYPGRLAMEARRPDGTFGKIYDEIISSNTYTFGKLVQSNEISAFMEPLYYYNFEVGRHFQSVITGESEASDLVISIDDPEQNTDLIQFWSNYSGRKGGLRLELIYSKF